MRETPWGYITYLDYRYKVECGKEAYTEIDRYCRQLGVDWMASVWDEPSVDFMEQFETPAYKVPSSLLTDRSLLKYARKTGRPVIVSTGMSTTDEIRRGIDAVGLDHLVIMHCTSAYPCEPNELNLGMIKTLRREFPATPIGYSGHEVSLFHPLWLLLWVLAWWSVTSPSTALCGAAIRPLLWNQAASRNWSSTSG